ncbi:MAG: ABC transporter substrate-binding protein, partial [Chloroflexota bacterium]|nr:ABC transporter substrate-binding protein [Chloroflexota bacterium]
MATHSLRFALSALASVLVLVSCGRDDPRPGRDSAVDRIPEEERFGGTVVVASIMDPQSMNALVSNEDDSRQVQRELLFMPLVKYDGALEPMPWLAERWDTARVAPDTLELTFHLRRDVSWHDGQPTTAEDVLFTYERVLDPNVGSSLASGFALYSPHAELVDSHTIKFRLRPHAEFLDGWAQLAVMPQHILEDVPHEKLASHPFGTSEPVGNGPFRFVRRVPGQEWVFEANPNFPAALGGRPYLDRLVYRVIPEQTTLLTETLTGAVDVNLAVGAEQVSQIEAAPGVELRSSPTTQWVFIAWNGRLPM